MKKTVLALALMPSLAIGAGWDETVTSPQPDDTIMINDVSQPDGSKTQYSSLKTLPVPDSVTTQLNTKVSLSGDETVNGIKNFTSSPIVPEPTTDSQAATKYYVDNNGGAGGPATWGAITGTLSDQDDLNTALLGKVNTTGSENINGVKTFLLSPIVPTPVSGTDAANKDYVDANAGGGGGVWGTITGTLSNQTDLQNALNAKAPALTLDDNYVTDAEKAVIGNTSGINSGDQDISGKVNTTGNETIAGVKTFSSSPTVPTPTTASQVANKGYVDNNGGGVPEAPTDGLAYGRSSSAWEPVPKTTDIIDMEAGTGLTYTPPAIAGDPGYIGITPGGVGSTQLADVITPISVTNANLTINSKGQVTAASNGTGGGGETPPTIQPEDPTDSDPTGWYLATTSGDAFYVNSGVGMFTLPGTYSPVATLACTPDPYDPPDGVTTDTDDSQTITCTATNGAVTFSSFALTTGTYFADAGTGTCSQTEALAEDGSCTIDLIFQYDIGVVTDHSDTLTVSSDADDETVTCGPTTVTAASAGIDEDFTDLDDWTIVNGGWGVSSGILTDSTTQSDPWLYYDTTSVSSNQHACIHFTNLTSWPDNSSMGPVFRAAADGSRMWIKVYQIAPTYYARPYYYIDGVYQGASDYIEITATVEDDSWFCGSISGTAASPTLTGYYFDDDPGEYPTWGSGAEQTFNFSIGSWNPSGVDGEYVGIAGTASGTPDPAATDFTGGAN